MEILLIVIPVFIGLLVMFHENAKKTAHLPRAPFGADAEDGFEEWRRWAEFDARSGQV